MVQSKDNLPSFNRRDKDKMALGFTPSTRSAELVAGARAYLLSTHETLALSKMAGRMVCRILTDMDRGTNIMWFFPARMMAIETLTKRHFAEDKPGLLLVDVAAGFSPRGLHLAQQYPQAQVVEIDLPEVVAEKKKRFEKGEIELPPNLSWIEADLGKANLSDLLEGRQANLITSEGLTLYLTPDENTRLFQQVSACLAPGGIFMCEIYFKNKLQKLQQNPNVNTIASFVFRIVGSVPGLMADAETAIELMSQAGLDQVTEYLVTDMMDEMGKPKPLDVISIMVAHKPVPAASDEVTSEAATERLVVESSPPLEAAPLVVEHLPPEAAPPVIEPPPPETH